MEPAQSPPEGWRITFGNKGAPGKPDRVLGVVTEFEPDTAEASRLFDRQANAWCPGADVRSSLPGYGYVGFVRGVRYVRMEWGPRQ